MLAGALAGPLDTVGDGVLLAILQLHGLNEELVDFRGALDVVEAVRVLHQLLAHHHMTPEQAGLELVLAALALDFLSLVVDVLDSLEDLDGVFLVFDLLLQ